MRALTLTQPWCGLVAAGIKRVENRPRPMIRACDFGQPFALHASREIDESIYPRIREAAPELFEGLDPQNTATWPSWYRLSRITRAVIGIATIHDALMIGGCSRDYLAELCARMGIPDQARWMFGPTSYLLRDNHALPAPVPCRGWQGFWTLSGDLERKILR